MKHHITPVEIMPPVCAIASFDELSQKGVVTQVNKVSKVDGYPTLTDFITEQCKNPEFKRLYERRKLIRCISKAVIKIRKDLGWTQAELAAKAGTTQPMIARVENARGYRMTSLDLLAKIAAATGCVLQIGFEKV